MPRIKEHNSWTLEQCHQRNRPMKAQTTNASEQELKATSVIAVETMMEQTGQKLVIPCFVMTSARPIWQGAVQDCAMVLGTNAMVKFGIQMIHADGSIIGQSALITTECPVDSATGVSFWLEQFT